MRNSKPSLYFEHGEWWYDDDFNITNLDLDVWCNAMDKKVCSHCHTPMNKGKALRPDYLVHGDFPGDWRGRMTREGVEMRGRTMSMYFDGSMMECYKCAQCGFSKEKLS